MGCSPPRMPLKEAIFGMYIANLFCVVKGLPPFAGEDKVQKRKDRLNDFYSRVKKILGNKKFLMGADEYVVPDEKDQILQHYCDEIEKILFNRRNDLKNMKIKGDREYLLFLDQIFDFFLSEKNLPSFINLIFSLISGGSIFTKEEDYEKDREWLDSFEFKV